jgi:hypothetical protein
MSIRVADDHFFDQLATDLTDLAADSGNAVNLRHEISWLVRGFLGFDRSCFKAPTYETAWHAAVAQTKALYTLNCTAYGLLYKDDSPILYFVIREKNEMSTMAQFIKNLEFLVYNSDFSALEQNPLLIKLKKLYFDACSAFFRYSSDYKSAKWGD